MATRTLARSQYQKEHSQVAQGSVPATGANSYVFANAYMGEAKKISVKVEFSAAVGTLASCVIRVIWTAADGTTKFLQKSTCTNQDLTGDTIETGYRHGDELTFDAHGAKSCRVDIASVSGTGSTSVWVAAY